MRPSIRDGDILLVAPIDSSQVQRGDVILFQQGERVLVHRVLGRCRANQERLIVKGDAHWKPDPPLSTQQVLGRVVGLERSGNIIELVRRRRRLAAARLCSGALYLGSRAFSLLRKAQRSILPTVQERDGDGSGTEEGKQ